MRTIKLMVHLSALCWMAHASASQDASTLCTADEYQYFSCRIDGSSKVVSLCGNIDFSDASRLAVDSENHSVYLQYRFGTPGHIDMLYPKTKGNSFKKFGGGNIRTYSATVLEVGFSVGRYQVSDQSTPSFP